MSEMSVVILCGGKSSRMGVDKAELKIGEETFLEYGIRKMQGIGPVFLSVSKRKNYKNAGFDIEIIEDIYDDCGPLGGLHAIFKRCETEKIFVKPVDLPYADQELEQELESYMNPGIDAVVPIDREGRLHPLCAVYRKKIADILELQLERKNYKVQNFLSKIRVCYVPVDKLTQGERKLDNLNTPEDYERMQKEYFIRKNSSNIPVIGIAAYSGSGKTTFLEKLIRELKQRKLRLAIIKHDAHDFTIDKEGKDSDRFTKAGADIVALMSSTKAVKMEHYEVSLMKMIESIHEVDLILLEGYKKECYPKMMLFREAAGKPPALDLDMEQPIAIISDRREWDSQCPVYDLNDANAVADFLIRKAVHDYPS